MSDEKLLLNCRELAALTGFSEGTLRHWVSEGRLPVVRFSARCVRFRLSDIQEWLAGKVIGPVGTKPRT
jgi:excisionase family DNA binding protein